MQPILACLFWFSISHSAQPGAGKIMPAGSGIVASDTTRPKQFDSVRLKLEKEFPGNFRKMKPF